MFIRGLVSMSLYYAKKSIKRVDLVQSGPHHHLIEKCFVKPRSGQTKYYDIVMCCFFDKNAPLRRKSKDWLAWNQDNVSGWGDMFIRGFVSMSQYYKTNKLSVLV